MYVSLVDFGILIGQKVNLNAPQGSVQLSGQQLAVVGDDFVLSLL